MHRNYRFLRKILEFLLLKIFFPITTFASDEELTTQISTEKTTKYEEESNAIWCPTNKIGNQCPEETLLSFYKCCGHLNKECCFHLRVWIVIMIIVLPLCLILPASTFLIRRLLCSTATSSSRFPRGSNPSLERVARQDDSTTIRRDSDEMVAL